MASLLTKDKISHKIALDILELVAQSPDAKIGLPTGRTPEALYKYLVSLSREKKVDWTKAKFFGLDEYINAPNAKTFKFYLEKNFYQPLKIDRNSCFNPIDIEDYDAFIKAQGGLDLTILGIGQNGHIAFNEPPCVKHTWTHCIELAASTREANKNFFESLGKVPERAVTMGIETLLSSKKIILLAFGEKKHEILKDALDGKVRAENPASYLQLHKNLSVFTDFGYET